MVNLKEARERKGYTQEKLASMCNITRQHISNIECGLNKPSVEVAKILAKALKIKWTDFFD